MTPLTVDSTAGLNAAILIGPARLVGYRYNSSLCVENQHPPPKSLNVQQSGFQWRTRTLGLVRVPVVNGVLYGGVLWCVQPFEKVGSSQCRIWAVSTDNANVIAINRSLQQNISLKSTYEAKYMVNIEAVIVYISFRFLFFPQKYSSTPDWLEPVL